MDNGYCFSSMLTKLSQSILQGDFSVYLFVFVCQRLCGYHKVEVMYQQYQRLWKFKGILNQHTFFNVGDGNSCISIIVCHWISKNIILFK